MTESDVIALLRDAIWLTIKLSSPLLLIGMAVGLVVSIFQTTTSLQEQTLTFVPKFVAILLAIVYFAGWMIQSLSDYTIELIHVISRL